MEDGWYALGAALLGLVAGFQGVCDRFQSNYFKAAINPLGITYMVSRALVSTVTFFGASAISILPGHPLYRAFLCGLGAETLLRSRFYALRVKKAEGTYEDWVKGPLDAWRWWQNLLLTTIDNRFSQDSIAPVEKIASSWESIEEMCEVFNHRILAWDEKRVDVADLKTKVSNLLARFHKEPAESGENSDSRKDKFYRLQLAHLVDDRLGREALEKIFGSENTP
jgi:hypothetical protein